MQQLNRAQNRQLEIILIKTEVAKENGHEVEREVSRSPILYANDTGPARKEYYAAQAANHRLDAVLEICALDYNQENCVEFSGARYNIFRAYSVSRDVVALSCERRVI